MSRADKRNPETEKLLNLLYLRERAYRAKLHAVDLYARGGYEQAMYYQLISMAYQQESTELANALDTTHTLAFLNLMGW
jgi:hypothetical protein